MQPALSSSQAARPGLLTNGDGQRGASSRCPLEARGSCLSGHGDNSCGTARGWTVKMTVSTYGEHAEKAAEALDLLVRGDVIPAEENAVRQLLHCREAVTDALRERLLHLGQDRSSSAAGTLPITRSSPCFLGWT